MQGLVASGTPCIITFKLHGYTVHQIMLNTFYYQLTHTTLKKVELLKHSKIDKLETLQHVSVYMETIFRELPEDGFHVDRNMLECF